MFVRANIKETSKILMRKPFLFHEVTMDENKQ